MRSLGKARAAPTIGESLYCAADEAPLVYNVKFAAVQMDANCFRGVYSVNCTQIYARSIQHSTAGGRLSIQEAFAMCYAHKAPDSQT